MINNFENDLITIKKYIKPGRTSIFSDNDIIAENLIDIFVKANIEYKKLSFKDISIQNTEGVKNIIIISDTNKLSIVEQFDIEYIYIPTSLYVIDIIDFINQPNIIIFNFEYSSIDYTYVVSQLAYYVLETYDCEIELNNYINALIKIISKLNVKERKYKKVLEIFSQIIQQKEINLFYLCIILLIRIYRAAKNVDRVCFPIDFDEKVKGLSKMLNISVIDILGDISKISNLDESYYAYKNDVDLRAIETAYKKVDDLIAGFKKSLKNRGFDMQVDVKRIYEFLSYAGLYADKNSDYFQLFVIGLF